MASIVQTPETRTAPKAAGPDRILLRNISWELYEQLREDVSNWGVRMAYDSGNLELMSPSLRHEEIRFRFDLFLVALARTLEFKFRGLASTTWKKVGAEKAKEADGCYYIANFGRIRGKEINLEVDPPPDLAIEIEVSRSAINSLNIYASIGVPEIWRFDGEAIHIHVRHADGSYSESDRSLALPFIQPEEIVSWMRKAVEIEDDMDWMSQVEDWARLELAPRLERH